MATKLILVLCVQTLLIKSALSRCIGLIEPASCGCASFVPSASTGGSFVVTSSSPVAPIGVSIVSDNIFEGALVMGGNLPLLGSVGVEGDLAAVGAGAVSYGCGDDVVAVVAEEGPVATGIVSPIFAAPFAFAPGYASYFNGFGRNYGMGFGIGCGPGIFGYGCGCF